MSNNKETLINGNSIGKEKKQRFRDLIKGVVKAIRISRTKHPNRLPSCEFLHLFGALEPEVLEGNYNASCQMILDKKELKGYQMGKTKVFLRAGQTVELDERRAEAARETGALKEAKEKLEKRVGEHTWNLQLEKQLRIDLEETKSLEISKLQDALHAMQSQFEEANSRVIREQEAARRAIEEAPPVIKNTPVFIQDTEKVDSSIVEVDSLKDKDDNNVLSCWLSHSSTLLWLLLQTLTKTGNAGSTRPSFLQGLRASPRRAGYSFLSFRMFNGLDDFQVEAKLPALLFKKQLTTCIEKIYGMIRDNMKKQISPLLGLCVRAPRTSPAKLVKGSHSQANVVAQRASVPYWQSIVKILNNYLRTLRDYYVAPFLVRKMFTQIFSFINVQLFNSILLRRECCSISNGEYVKTGLAELEQWCVDVTEEYAGSAWDELKHVKQAIGFLIIPQKPKMAYEEITEIHCPVLNRRQLYSLGMMYHDEKYGTQSVSEEILTRMRILIEKWNDKVSDSFLLDDDSSIPFSVDDISKSMPLIEIGDINPPPLICENSLLVLLLRHT